MRKQNIYKKGFIVFLIIVMLFTTTGCGIVKNEIEESETQETTESENEKSTELDAVRKQDDFYAAINKEEILSYEVNSMDIGAGSAYEINDVVNNELENMILDIVNSKEEYEVGSDRWLVRETYKQLKSYSKEDTLKPVTDYYDYVDYVNNINNVEDALEAFGTLKDRYGVLDLYNFDVSADMRNSDKNAIYIYQSEYFQDYKFSDIYEDDDLRKEIKTYVTDMLVLSGKNYEEAERIAKDFVYYLIDISRETDYEIENVSNFFSTIEYMTNDEINENLENITIEQIEKNLNISNPYGGYYVQDINQIKAISKLFSEENLDIIKAYLICEYSKKYGMFISSEYPILKAYVGDINNQNEKRICNVIVSILPYQISDLYAEYYYTDEMDEYIKRMQKDITCSYEQLISEADWLTVEGKKCLLEKLHNMTFVCGGGKKWLTYEDNKSILGKTFYETYIKSNTFKQDVMENKIGKPADHEIADMNSFTVNASYNCSNTFVITVAIMHAPYFDVNASYEENLGGLGMVTGHEMGHAFDSNCMAFDANGNYNVNWLPEEDRDVLASRLEDIEEYYSNYTVMDIYHVDGKKTAGENYADLGAMECLMKIVTSSEGRAKLFENYAKIWCEYREDTDVIFDINYDEHSPSVVRVNAVLSSTDEFYNVYSVSPGDGMYIDKEKRVSRWK